MMLKEKITRKLFDMGIANDIWHLLWLLHLDATSLHNWKDNPTPAMIEARKYFAEHEDDIENNISFFADDESKDIYRQCRVYRETYDRKLAPHYTVKNQYFVKDLINLSSDEVFIDCGAYDGDTIRRFSRYVGGQYSKVVAFEADDANFIKLKRRHGGDSRIVPIKAAVWSEDTTLSFTGDATEGSKVAEAGEHMVKAVAIDNIPECRDATYIKMDIEGAESDALKGAEQTISRNHPKLAICIYHSNSDFVNIPKYIHEKYPLYKLYIRHHCWIDTETVLYAIP